MNCKFTRYSVVILALLYVSFAYNTVYAQGADKTKKSYNLYFKINETKVNKGYKDNNQTINVLIDEINNSITSENLEVKSVLIIASASPDGTAALNRYIAKQRALNTKRMLLSMFPHLDENNIFTHSKTNMWDNLKQLIDNEPSLKYKDEMYAILNNSELSYSEKYDAFRSNLELYRYLKSHFLDKLRMAKLEFTLAEIPVKVPDVVVEKVVAVTKSEVEHVNHHFGQECESHLKKVDIPLLASVFKTSEEFDKGAVLALKTNILYDIALVPNLGFEFYLADKVSFAGSWMYAWWNKDSKNHTWRIYGGDVAIKKWFGSRAADKRFTGHHLGVYGQMLTYDFDLGNKGYIGEKWTFGAGVEYGYSFPVSNKLNIDLNLGLGYLSGEVKEYNPEDGHYVWQKTTNRQWIGPTRAGVSVVWLMGL